MGTAEIVNMLTIWVEEYSNLFAFQSLYCRPHTVLKTDSYVKEITVDSVTNSSRRVQIRQRLEGYERFKLTFYFDE